MTYSEMQSHVALLLGTKLGSNQQLLTAARVQFFIARAMEWLYEQALLKRRVATLLAADDQAQYTFPYDMFTVESVNYDGKIVAHVDLVELEDDYDENWRVADPGTVESWGLYDLTSISLYRPPDDPSSVDIDLDGFCVPFSPGSAIATIARAANVITITTDAAHNLREGETVTVQRCSTAGLNVDLTVAEVTSTTSFTAAHTGSAQNDTDGYLIYTGGLLPLTDDTDVPAFNPRYHELAPLSASLMIAETFMSTDERAKAGMEGLARRANELMIGLKGNGGY